jgi:hypothetical protein
MTFLRLFSFAAEAIQPFREAAVDPQLEQPRAESRRDE